MMKPLQMFFALTCVTVVLCSGVEQAEACGGFFCSQSSPVNQAAERIIFIDNDDDTVTALVQIMYEGPSENFAWVLPVPGVPEVGVSSDQAFQIVQQLTNPQYNLQTQFEDDCNSNSNGSTSNGTSVANGATGTSNGTTGGVNVLASGSVGPYDYTVIMADPNSGDPADEALEWLEDNGYDVAATAPELMRPYLRDGMNLLAFKLTKGNDAGDIRPVMLTYSSERPMIPLKLTAVAANDNMGVLAWVLSNERSVPVNYRSLEINEALIDWFNSAQNYNAVINSAADEAGGQGFVTEMAADSTIFNERIFGEGQLDYWNFLKLEIANVLETERDEALVNRVRSIIGQVVSQYNGWDGMAEAGRVLLPDSEGDVLAHLACVGFEGQVSGRRVNCNDGTSIDLSLLDYIGYMDAVEEAVVEPMRLTQELLDSRPYMTRMYTTMSAAEMTVDPVFDVNSELGDVSNIHQATQWISCRPDVSGYEWRVQLASGDVVYGQTSNQWSYNVGDMPANARITQEGTSGEGEVVEDNATTITSALSQDVPRVVTPLPGDPNPNAGGSGADEFDADEEGCACSSMGGDSPSGGPLGGVLAIVAGLGALIVVRQRRF